MENFGKFMSVVILLVLTPIVNGFVLVKLWSWFIVSTFSVNPLRIPEAIGIMTILGFLIYHNTESKTKSFWEQFYESIGSSLGRVLVALVLGYIVKSFI